MRAFSQWRSRLTLVVLAALAQSVLCALSGAGPATAGYGLGVVWTAATNGIRFGMRPVYRQSGGCPWIELLLEDTTGSNARSTTTANQPNSRESETGARTRIKYFMATNSCWGPVEIRDARGRAVRATQPDVNSETAYPPSYSLTAARRIMMHAYRLYSGPPLPIALTPNEPLPSLNIKEFFRLKNSGEYKLTLWPKIYVYHPESDRCQRLDLPAVSVPITCEEDRSRSINTFDPDEKP
jgi:hypothetical protein